MCVIKEFLRKMFSLEEFQISSSEIDKNFKQLCEWKNWKFDNKIEIQIWLRNYKWQETVTKYLEIFFLIRGFFISR